MALADILREAGLSDEEITAQLAVYDANPRVREALDRSTMRQADYSRNMDDIKKYKSDLDSNWSKANAEFLKMQQDVDSTKAERDAAAQKLKEAEEKLKNAPTFDAASLHADLDRKQASFAAGSVAYMGDVFEAGDTYQELFGKPLNRKQFMQDAAAAKKSPLDYAEETYKFSEKRAERDKAEREKQDEAIRKEAREQAIAEFQNPATRPLQDSQNPFHISSTEAKNPWDDDATQSPAYKNMLTALHEAGR